jgi:hypothetical protein
MCADTLMEALDYPGGKGLQGGARILMRAAVAALLNASHPDVYYPTIDAQVDGDAIIEAVCEALSYHDRSTLTGLAEELDRINNDYPCPINAHCERILDEEPEPVTVG